MDPSIGQAQMLTHLAKGELSAYDEEQESLWATVTSLVDAIRVKLTDTITSALSSVLKFCDGYIPAISAIVSAVITLLTSIITLAVQYNSTTVKVALGVGILAALTSFVSNVAILFKAMGSWQPDKAQSAAVELASSIASRVTHEEVVVANALDFKTWITVGVTSLVAVLFAGLGLSGAVTWRDLVTGGNVLESIRKTQNNVSNVADFVLKDVVGLELDKDYPQCLALEDLANRGAALQQSSVAEFVQKPDLLFQLKKYVLEVVTITSRKMTIDSSRRYNTVRQLLVEIYRQLSQKLDAVNAILATKPRQVTVGLMLSGPPGHGKSEFGKYICKRVARALGYPDAPYCLNKKSDGFYEPYGGNAIGVYNEFMALRSEDAILKDLNLILSSDPMNFEAACLEGKSQPCQLKIVFLTANAHNPEIVRVLSEGATRAMWDRIYHIGVNDPKCLGRHHPNVHRKPDFSHLDFTLIKHSSPDNLSHTPISLKDIEDRLVGRCAIAERDYIREVLTAEPIEAVATALMDRSRLLGELLLRHQPYDVVTPNALGREFFITRFQGVPGSGKSTLAEQVAKECSGLFSYDIQYSRCNEEFIPVKTPMIYVLDDWVEESNIELYVPKMNMTHDRSIFILTSNTVFGRTPFYKDMVGSSLRALGSLVGLTTACPWDATWYHAPSGVYRRLGLQGFIRIPGGSVIQTPEHFQKTYNFGENFIVYDAYGRVGNRDEILESIFKSYRLYLTRPTEYTLINGIPPVMKDPAVTIEAPSAFDLISGLRSKKKCMDAYLGRADGFKLIVAPRLRGPSASSQTMVSTWIVVEEPSDDQAVLHSVWSRMCASFGRTFPGESLLLRLTQSNTVYYYENGVAYTYGPEALQDSIPVEIQGDKLIYHRDSQTPIVVTPAQFAAARLYNQFSGPMISCSAAEYRAINRAYIAELSSNRNSQFVSSYLIEEQRAHSKFSSKALWLQASLKAHPIFWIGVSLLSLVCAGGIFYSFIKLAQAIHYYFSSKSETVDNSASPKDSKGFNPARAALRKITPFRNSSSPQDGKGHNPAKRILKRITTHHNAPEYLDDYYSSPTTPKAISDMLFRIKETGESAEWALRDLLNSNPQYQSYIDTTQNNDLIRIRDNMYSLEVQANMLSPSDMIVQPPSDLESLYLSLRKSYVHVSSNDGSCYGIHLQGGIILTVSHLFSVVGESATVRNNGAEFKAHVVSIYRDRDLALVKVTDSRFAPPPVTKRFFVPFQEVQKPKYGFFMRCGTECQLLGGLINYYKTTLYPITSEGNNNYHLSESVIVHVATALGRTRSFIKGGDCGFPLVASTSAGFRLMGIHNGYNQTEKSYYSTVTLEDYEAFIRDATVSPNNDPSDIPLHHIELLDVEHEGLLPLPYVDALEDLRAGSQYEHYSDKLHILGYSPELALRSKPRDQHFELEVPGMITERLTLPAAYTMNRVEDTSLLAVNSGGYPDPLFTQCLKYDKSKVPTYSPQILDEACGLVMQECVSRYGGCRFLRLHETLNGVSGGSLPPIDSRTSGGPLLKLVYKIHTKAPVLNTITTPYGKDVITFANTPPGKMVRSHFESYKAALIDDNIPPILFSKDCAKVELIDAEKAIAGKVRLFNEVDFSINLLFRSFFGDFTSKIMDKHLDAPIRMGMNPYVASTAIQRQFNEIDGNLVSTDFSSFDKQLPLELIQAFCWIVSRCMTGTHMPWQDLEDIYFNLAKSLTYVIHSCRGHIYLVDRGNESGTFVTTPLNSISVDILTTYTLVRKWQTIFKFTPSLSELNQHSRKAILGDDRSLKISSQLPVSQEDLIEDSKLFCLKCTPAKTESGLDFCSRALHWDERWQVSWPALKIASVTSQLHWTTSFSEKQLLENCDNAIFEAALHPEPKIFIDVLSDALSILRQYDVPYDHLKFHSRDLIRRRFLAVVRQTSELDIIKAHIDREERDNPVEHIIKVQRTYDVKEMLAAERIAEKNLDYKFLRQSLRDFDLSQLTIDVETNPVGYLLEILQCKQLHTRIGEDFEKVNNGWLCTLYLFGESATACAPNKKRSKTLAYRALFDKLYGGIVSSDTKRIEQKSYHNSAESINDLLVQQTLPDSKESYCDRAIEQLFSKQLIEFNARPPDVHLQQ